MRTDPCLTRRGFLALSGAFGLGAILAACGGASPAPASSAPAGTQAAAASNAPATQAASPAASAPSSAAASGAGKTLVVAEADVPQGFDDEIFVLGLQQSQANTQDNLLNFQVKSDPGGIKEIVPGQIEGRLAESWTVSPDGTKVTFKLRQGVKSAFGNELTADDVKWSWDRALKVPPAIQTVLALSSVTDTSQYKAVDKYTFEIDLPEPNQLLLNVIPDAGTPTVYDSTELKKHATQSDPWAKAWLQTNTAGFGPYQLTSVQKGQGANFTANPNYFRGKPYYTNIVYKGVPSPANRAALLEANSVQLASELTPQLYSDLAKKSGVQVPHVTGNKIAIARMNYNFPPFDRKEFRQALAYSFPYKQVLDTVYLGTAKQLKGPIIDFVSGFAGDKFWKYDAPNSLDQAKSLLKSSGLDGAKFNITVVSTQAIPTAIAEIARSAWNALGLQSQIETLQPADYIQRRTKRDIPLLLSEDQSIVLEPTYNLSIYFSSKFGGANNSNFKDPEVDDLLNKLRTEADKTKRQQMLDRIQQIVIEDAPYLYIAAEGGYQPMRSNIQGWIWHSDNRPRWFDLKEA